MVRGIITSALITTGSYIFLSIISIIVGFVFAGFYLFADVHFVLGTVIGVIFTLNNREKNQGILKSGAFAGVLGGILSAFFISFYQLILIAILIVPDITVFFLYLGLSLVSGIAIGLIVGALISTYYTYREMKEEPKVKESSIDDDFDFDKLI